MKLKVFSGFTMEVQNGFNKWFNPEEILILKILAGDSRLYIFYKEI